MRACNPSCLSHFTYLGTTINPGAGFNFYGVHVAIKTDKTMTVVKDDGVTIKKIVAGS